MNKSKHSITSWLKEYGDPEVEKQVEEELNRFMAENYKQDVEEAERKLEEYINYRIIKELEKHISNITEYNMEVRSSVVVTAIQEDMLNSIKQLKQK